MVNMKRMYLQLELFGRKKHTHTHTTIKLEMVEGTFRYKDVQTDEKRDFVQPVSSGNVKSNARW